MHPPEIKALALELIAQGVNDCEISRRIGVPRATIRDWRRPRYVPRGPAPETCIRCWRPSPRIRFSSADYAEFLALYLGDGCISEHPRTQRLRIALDKKYPQIIADASDLLDRCFPDNSVDQVDSIGGVYVSLYCAHLACLLPQHGPGRKHDRAIELEDWQSEILVEEPWPFIRGCIRTDGCAFINRTDVHRDEPYEYLSTTSRTSRPTSSIYSWRLAIVSESSTERRSAVLAVSGKSGSIDARRWSGCSRMSASSVECGRRESNPHALSSHRF